eukprot:10386872-Ditylum_brightwellii.AAC.1
MEEKLPVESTQCMMREHKKALDELGSLHVPDIDNNKMNGILSVADENFLDLQEEVPLTKPAVSQPHFPAPPTDIHIT